SVDLPGSIAASRSLRSLSLALVHRPAENVALKKAQLLRRGWALTPKCPTDRHPFTPPVPAIMKFARLCCAALSLAAVSFTGLWALAQEKKTENKERLAFTDPEKAGSDFTIQGEYAGEIKREDQTVKIGVQVIALGDGKFRAVAYHGGLPGDGWN